jgi:hypothetical protein
MRLGGAAASDEPASGTSVGGDSPGAWGGAELSVAQPASASSKKMEQISSKRGNKGLLLQADGQLVVNSIKCPA